MQIIATPGAVWQGATDRIHQAFLYNFRDGIESAAVVLGHVTRVAGKQFIAAVAGEHNLDVLARQFGDNVSWNSRRVSKRLIEMPGETVDHFTDVRCNAKLVVLGAKLLCRQSCILEFVVTVFIEPDRKSLDRLIHVARHERHHRTRIDAAREKRSQRHIGNESQLHSFV